MHQIYVHNVSESSSNSCHTMHISIPQPPVNVAQHSCAPFVCTERLDQLIAMELLMSVSTSFHVVRDFVTDSPAYAFTWYL